MSAREPRKVRLFLVRHPGDNWTWGAEREDAGPDWAMGGGIQASTLDRALHELGERLMRMASLPRPDPGKVVPLKAPEDRDEDARVCANCGEPVRRKLSPMAELLVGATGAGVLCVKCAGPELDAEKAAEAWGDLGKLIDQVGEEDPE